MATLGVDSGTTFDEVRLASLLLHDDRRSSGSSQDSAADLASQAFAMAPRSSSGPVFQSLSVTDGELPLHHTLEAAEVTPSTALYGRGPLGWLYRTAVRVLRQLGVRHPEWYVGPSTVLVLLMGVIAAVLLILVVANWDTISPWLNNAAASIREMGFSGYLLMASIVFILCFPPLIGYGTALYFCGFVFRFPLGILPIFVGSSLGALAGFSIGRQCLRQYRNGILRRYPNFSAIEDAVHRGGLRLLIIIRLAPYPFGLSNLLFSATKIELRTFMTATCVSQLKNFLHVYIGSTLASFADIKTQKSPAQYFALCLSAGIAIGVLVYLTIRVRAVLAEQHISDSQVGVLGAAAGPAEEEVFV